MDQREKLIAWRNWNSKHQINKFDTRIRWIRQIRFYTYINQKERQKKDRQADRRRSRQVDGQVGRQTGRQRGGQAGRQIDAQIDRRIAVETDG